MAQQQKIMLYAYPFIFAVVGFNFPIGTLIYWLTTNFWTMGQQFYVIRRNPTPGSAAYEALEARRKAHDKARGLLEPEVVTEALPAPKRQQPKRKPRSQRRPPRPGSTPPKSAGPDDSASEHAVAPGDSPDDDESKEAS